MNEEGTTTDFFLGLGAGYLVARFLADGANPVYFGDVRLHHYLVGVLALFADNQFTKGFVLGVALDDIADLIDDLYPGDADIQQITDSIREFQGKTKHHL